MNNPFNQVKLGPPIDPMCVPFSDDSFSDFNGNKVPTTEEFSVELNFKSIDVSRLDIQPDNFSAE